MTQEEKELLLKDLCSRLPYGVMIHVEHDWFEDEVPSYDALLTLKYHSILNNFSENPLTCCLIIKPYLRPMSSMTDEEKEEFHDIGLVDLPSDDYDVYDHKGVEIVSFPWNKRNDFSFDFDDFNTLLDWLNKKHFDYRGLIEKGLALEAPEDMYND